MSENERGNIEEERKYWLESIGKLLNKISYKRTRKPIDFNLANLETHNGRMKFRVDLENLGLSHLELHSHI